MIELRNLSWDNWEECLKLEVNDDQKSFVAPNTYSIAQAYVHLTNDKTPPFSYAVYGDGVMVGYALYYLQHAEDRYYICRFMIDKRFQGKGYGRQAMIKILEHIRTFPSGKAGEVAISYEPENTTAKKLYESLGFRETGEIEEGELVATLKL